MKESSFSNIKRLLNLILHFESKLQSLHFKPDNFPPFCSVHFVNKLNQTKIITFYLCHIQTLSINNSLRNLCVTNLQWKLSRTRKIEYFYKELHKNERVYFYGISESLLLTKVCGTKFERNAT